MEKHILSKSTFIKGYHCPKSLYLYKKRPFLRDKLTAEQRAKFKRGHHVGDLAQEIFSGGIDVSPKSPSQYQKSVLRTSELIEQGQEIIYEATFQHEQVLVMLDLLVKTEKGWMAYEVKSSKHLSETYYTDAALQYWVIQNSGLYIEQFFLVYVDENYRLEGDIDLKKYFLFEDVTDNVLGRQEFIGEKVVANKAVLLEKHSPKVEVGNQCFSPYKCDFVGHCWKKIADKPYVAENISFAGILGEEKADRIPISCIYNEQAVTLCQNEKAYSPQFLGFQIGENEAVVSGKTCEDKKAFILSYFEQINLEESYVVFEESKLRLWIEEVKILVPEIKEKAEALVNKSIGILDLMEEKEVFPTEKRSFYTPAWFSKNHSDGTLSKSVIYSDILANELYGKMKADLWGADSPDLESLKLYLTQLNHLSLELYQML
ncbi:hypothetical protein [Lentimicrobium sp. S6]|uniref:hypothetical protein n=1 Tax=Lentimicrobium sp. S6 TaxID=2735872 RepID=UPI001555B5E8|nr:hypothetical protein [Lentimicrobium sp. S6]NPD44264.1 hypothetical protein [Lentimicrobium sp. S6]